MAKDQNSSEKSILTKERGEGFPRLSLPSAIVIMEKASKYGRQWTRDQFASFSSKSGGGSAKSGAFNRRIASLRDFGLIQTSGVMIVRTDLTDQIVKPIKPEERESAIRQAFLNVEIFRIIVETVEHDADLSKNDVAEMAVKQLGISRTAKDTFVSSFVESGELAGIVREIDKETIQIFLSEGRSGPNVTASSQESSLKSSPIGRDIPPVGSTTSIADVGSTTFSARRAGKTWDLQIQVRSSLSVNPEVIAKIVRLIQDGEQIAKSLKEMEDKDGSTNNQSETESSR